MTGIMARSSSNVMLPYRPLRSFLESAPAARLPHRWRATLAHKLLRQPRVDRVVVPGEDGRRGASHRAVLVAFGDLAFVRRDGMPALHASQLDALRNAVGAEALLTANFEAPIATPEDVRAGSFGSFLHTVDNVDELLARLPDSVLTVANNHALDYGVPAFERTVSTLAAHDVATVGQSGQAPVIIERNGVTMAFLGACDDVRLPSEQPSPVALIDDRELEASIRLQRARGYVVVLHLHWGFEWSCVPPRSYRDRARAFSAAGAQVVLCHHAHVPLGVERTPFGVIAHGLGNGFFPFASAPQHPLRDSVQYLRIGIDATGVVSVDVDFLQFEQAAGLRTPTSGVAHRWYALQNLANTALSDSARLERAEWQRVSSAVRSVGHWCRVALNERQDVEAALAEAQRLLHVPLRRNLPSRMDELGLKSLANAMATFRDTTAHGQALRAAAEGLLSTLNEHPTRRRLAAAFDTGTLIGWLP